MPDYPKTLEHILFLLDEAQANDIVTIDVRNQTTITDYMVIASGRSSRHVKAIAMQVMEKMKADGTPAINNSGVEFGDWALVDFGDFIIHVMQPESRTFYNLEELWQEQH